MGRGGEPGALLRCNVSRALQLGTPTCRASTKGTWSGQHAPLGKRPTCAPAHATTSEDRMDNRLFKLFGFATLCVIAAACSSSSNTGGTGGSNGGGAGGGSGMCEPGKDPAN